MAATMQGALAARSDTKLNAPRMAIRDLNFFYGSNKALKGINLDLPERQVTGMIGLAGAASPPCCAA